MLELNRQERGKLVDEFGHLTASVYILLRMGTKNTGGNDFIKTAISSFGANIFFVIYDIYLVSHS